ncbi:uncharacterized protein DNG_08898 [Cephalotrichum gorgonifer]|uniref:Uncharacterized protein n=1 Tax=Cephalotrichum gorgonifer TaxID=2041049 RepID=A0AAE8SYS9_9PEZI|nr:uncharacterized protein DNG_08898 [Cephalotrichum gorgonifer]
MDIYLASTHPYGPESLLTASDGRPGLGVCFLHKRYLVDPTWSGLEHASWKRWLCDFIGIREQLCLASRSNDSLSDAFKHVIKYRPEKILHVMHHSWRVQGRMIEKSAQLKAEIRNIPADSLCGKPGLPKTCTLQDTYLPYQSLREQAARFMDDSKIFPFLDIDGFGSAGDDTEKWTFLRTAFGVKGDDTAEFLVDILRWTKHHWATNLGGEPVGKARLLKVRDLYLAIATKVFKSGPATEELVS